MAAAAAAAAVAGGRIEGDQPAIHAPVPVLCRRDNYAYIIRDASGEQVAVVDPVQPQHVISAMESLGLSLGAIKYILTTHKHEDHAGGNNDMKALLRKAGNESVLVIGGRPDSVSGEDQAVWDSDILELGDLNIAVLATPGHTRGSVSFHVSLREDSNVPGHIFTGDCLFIGGSGRFFEGTGEDMQKSFDQLRALPDETRVWTGHEYTVNNYKFAVAVDPNNEALQEQAKFAQAKRTEKQHTQGVTLLVEKNTNPFMRTHVDVIQAAVRNSDKSRDFPELSDIMGQLRHMKNNFGLGGAGL